MSDRIRTAALALLMLAPAGAARAQEDAEGAGAQDYQKLMQQMLKSGSYDQGQGGGWDARLKVVSGEVLLKPSGSEAWTKVSGEVPLDPDDAVKTAGDGVAELYLDDKGALALGRNTLLEVGPLDQGDTSFSLSYGSVAAKIKHFLSDRFKMQFRTPSAVCAVRGTEFALEHSQMGKRTSVAVYDEGKLAVTPLTEDSAEGQEYTLEKNNEISIAPDQKRFRVSPIARMARYRGNIVQMRSRVLALKNWKPRTAARRAALRDAALKRRVLRRRIDKRGGKGVRSKRPARGTGRKARPVRRPAREEPEE